MKMTDPKIRTNPVISNILSRNVVAANESNTQLDINEINYATKSNKPLKRNISGDTISENPKAKQLKAGLISMESIVQSKNLQVQKKLIALKKDRNQLNTSLKEWHLESTIKKKTSDDIASKFKKFVSPRKNYIISNEECFSQKPYTNLVQEKPIVYYNERREGPEDPISPTGLKITDVRSLNPLEAQKMEETQSKRNLLTRNNSSRKQVFNNKSYLVNDGAANKVKCVTSVKSSPNNMVLTSKAHGNSPLQDPTLRFKHPLAAKNPKSKIITKKLSLKSPTKTALKNIQTHGSVESTTHFIEVPETFKSLKLTKGKKGNTFENIAPHLFVQNQPLHDLFQSCRNNKIQDNKMNVSNGTSQFPSFIKWHQVQENTDPSNFNSQHICESRFARQGVTEEILRQSSSQAGNQIGNQENPGTSLEIVQGRYIDDLIKIENPLPTDKYPSLESQVFYGDDNVDEQIKQEHADSNFNNLHSSELMGNSNQEALGLSGMNSKILNLNIKQNISYLNNLDNERVDKSKSSINQKIPSHGAVNKFFQTSKQIFPKTNVRGKSSRCDINFQHKIHSKVMGVQDNQSMNQIYLSNKVLQLQENPGPSGLNRNPKHKNNMKNQTVIFCNPISPGESRLQEKPGPSNLKFLTKQMNNPVKNQTVIFCNPINNMERLLPSNNLKSQSVVNIVPVNDKPGPSGLNQASVDQGNLNSQIIFTTPVMKPQVNSRPVGLNTHSSMFTKQNEDNSGLAIAPPLLFLNKNQSQVKAGTSLLINNINQPSQDQSQVHTREVVINRPPVLNNGNKTVNTGNNNSSKSSISQKIPSHGNVAGKQILPKTDVRGHIVLDKDSKYKLAVPVLSSDGGNPFYVLTDYPGRTS